MTIGTLSLKKMLLQKISLDKTRRIQIWNALRSNAALSALLLQLAAFTLVCIMHAVFAWCGISLPIYLLFILQAALAAGLSCLFVTASWWHYIQGGFPLLVLLMLAFQLPQSFYTAGFLLTLGLYWTTFRSQVPFFPSARSVEQQLLTLIPEHAAPRVIDIGSGVGGLMMKLSQHRPGASIEGIEIAPIPWLISRGRAWLRGSKVRFRYGDYHQLDFAQYDVIYAYLSPAVMTDLWHKARCEMRPGSLLVSYEFAIDTVPATQVLHTHSSAPQIYVWRM